MKRLRIEAEIALPADPFEEADAVSKMREPIAALKSVVEAAGGKVAHSVVAERAVKKKTAEPTPLVPRHHSAGGHAAE